MISSHKKILLSECRASFGRRGPDTIRVVCEDGHSFVHVLIIASLMPWLKEDLLYQQFYCDFSRDDESSDPCLILPSLSINDLNSFMVQILSESDKIFFGQNMFYNVLQLFGIVVDNFVIFSDQDILFEDNCSTVELSVDVTTNVEVVIDAVEDLSDDLIVDHFSNQNGELVCLVCYKIFASNSDLSSFRAHLSSHSLSSKKLRQLLKIDSGKTLKEKTKSPSKKATKLDKDSGGKSFSCSTCDKTFRKLTLLNQHQFRQHGQALAQAQLACQKCSFKCTNTAGLKAHLRSHGDKGTFECELCRRKFNQSHCLESHRKSGICKIENRKCHVCKKVFVDSTRLKIHLMTHTGERPWSCQICQKSFSQRRSLKEHEAIHSERPHPCSHCDKKFVQKNHLKYHIASCHGGGGASLSDLKHVCKICSRAYAFPFQLRNHEAQHVSKLISHFRASEKETMDFEKK